LTKIQKKYGFTSQLHNSRCIEMGLEASYRFLKNLTEEFLVLKRGESARRLYYRVDNNPIMGSGIGNDSGSSSSSSEDSASDDDSYASVGKEDPEGLIPIRCIHGLLETCTLYGLTLRGNGGGNGGNSNSNGDNEEDGPNNNNNNNNNSINDNNNNDGNNEYYRFRLGTFVTDVTTEILSCVQTVLLERMEEDKNNNDGGDDDDNNVGDKNGSSKINTRDNDKDAAVTMGVISSALRVFLKSMGDIAGALTVLPLGDNSSNNNSSSSSGSGGQSSSSIGGFDPAIAASLVEGASDVRDVITRSHVRNRFAKLRGRVLNDCLRPFAEQVLEAAAAEGTTQQQGGKGGEGKGIDAKKRRELLLIEKRSMEINDDDQNETYDMERKEDGGINNEGESDEDVDEDIPGVRLVRAVELSGAAFSDAMQLLSDAVQDASHHSNGAGEESKVGGGGGSKRRNTRKSKGVGNKNVSKVNGGHRGGKRKDRSSLSSDTPGGSHAAGLEAARCANLFAVWFAGVLEAVAGCGTGPVLDVGSHIFVTEGLKDNNVITESTGVDDYTGMNNDRGQSGTDYRGIDNNDNGNDTLNEMVLNLRDMATDRQYLELTLTVVEMRLVLIEVNQIIRTTSTV